VAQDVAVAVVATDLEVAVLGVEPAVEFFGNGDAAAAGCRSDQPQSTNSNTLAMGIVIANEKFGRVFARFPPRVDGGRLPIRGIKFP